MVSEGPVLAVGGSVYEERQCTGNQVGFCPGRKVRYKNSSRRFWRKEIKYWKSGRVF